MPARPLSQARPILLDTDIGSDVDDALALAFVLACPEALDLVAVTTVCGDTRLRAQIAARLLVLADRNDIDVCAGEGAPLLRDPSRFVWFGLEQQCVAEGPALAISGEPAPERIVRAAREVPGLEIVLIGPLTNLARALVLDPELPHRVAGITVMGGHVRRVMIGDHECAPGVDYNLCSDPEASVAVLGAGFETTLVTGDVTLQTWMTRAQLDGLSSAGPVAREVAAQVRRWTPVQQAIFTGLGGTLTDDNVAFLHDPLTLLALVDPEPLQFERLPILPTIREGVMRTLEVGPGGAGSELGIPMNVATKVEAQLAARQIAERLQRL